MRPMPGAVPHLIVRARAGYQFVALPLLVAFAAYRRIGKRRRAFAEMQGAPAASILKARAAELQPRVDHTRAA